MFYYRLFKNYELFTLNEYILHYKSYEGASEFLRHREQKTWPSLFFVSIPFQNNTLMLQLERWCYNNCVHNFSHDLVGYIEFENINDALSFVIIGKLNEDPLL